MTLSRDFEKTVVARTQVDRIFAKELLNEAVVLFPNGEMEIAEFILINFLDAKRALKDH